MSDRQIILDNLVSCCSGSIRKKEILKAVRKKKHYEKVSEEVGTNPTYCSRVLNNLTANGLVEKYGKGYFRQVPIVRTFNIDSELKKYGKKPFKRKEMEKSMDKPKILKILDFDKALENLGLETTIIEDCFPLRKPYRIQVGEAYLTLENFIRDEIGLEENLIGTDLISAASKAGLFNRKVRAEQEGLNHLFRASVLWMRNPAHHKKSLMSKEDALKMILFADYLIKLIRNQKNMNNL